MRVNAVAPGAVNSPWQKDWPEERKRASIENAVLKRRCEPEDIAEVVADVAAARYLTGQVVVVDGGASLR